jgi:hypothetical protein
MRRTLVWILSVLAALAAIGIAGDSYSRAQAPAPGGLVVTTEGLPPGERPLLIIRAPDGHRTRARADTLTLPSATPGDYLITIRRHRIHKRYRTIRRGAVAFPAHKTIRVTVRSGATAKVPAAFGTIVNPRVSKVPRGLQYIVGSPARPRELVYRARRRLPGRGHILLGAPSATFPHGLVVRVRGVSRDGRRRILRVRPVAISLAVPTFEYDGAGITLQPAGPVAASASQAHAASGCDGPKDFDMGAKLDEFVIRRANARAWPPQMSFQVAVRTTERFGPRAAVAGAKCNWTLGQLGPWQGAIPTPIGVPIPVYATIPVAASVNVEGALSAFRLNLASTSVLNVDLGRYNNVGFWQEGSNVWVDGALQMSGKARAGINLSLQMGVGSAAAGNLHVSAGFGPNVSWVSGAGCDVDLALGALSAGVKIGWFSANTPPFSPFSKNLWHGCDGAPPVGGGGGGGTTPTPTPTAPTPTPIPPGGGGGGGTPPPPAVWHEQEGSLGANTFVNPYNASGMGPRVAAYQWVDIACKVYAPQIQSANPDGYWYRIASAPWNGQYYAVANTFWNGDIPGQKPYTHNTDWAVPNC